MTNLQTGCLIGDTYGWHMHYMMVEYAIEQGFPMSDEDREDLKAYKEDGSASDVSTLVDQGGLMERAEEWLNEHVAQEGHSFGWSAECGGFFYQTNEWWDED